MRSLSWAQTPLVLSTETLSVFDRIRYDREAMSHIELNCQYYVFRNKYLTAIKSVCEKCPHFATESHNLRDALDTDWACTFESKKNEELHVVLGEYQNLPLDCPYTESHAVDQPPPWKKPKWLDNYVKQPPVVRIYNDESFGWIAVRDEDD